jgi:hypothetical protein
MRLGAFLLSLSAAFGQHNHGGHNQHQHGAFGRINPAGMFLMNQASGTAYNPELAPMPMLGASSGAWTFMWMGQAYLQATQQSGPRGADKLFAPNFTMLSAQRNAGARGNFMIRAMATIEPLTITRRSYPLLFQTGEAAYGEPLTDAQHPHELLMELSVQYAHQLSRGATFNVYYAPVGDAPLGPVAFPHRASAVELPQAVLAHHWQDSTHIVNQVLTAGLSYRRLRIEAGGFHGAEPNENRWNIDYGPIDSWAARLLAFPSPQWAAQFSVGRLHKPEAFHPDDIVRATASVHHTTARAWSSSFIWARNYKTIDRRATHAVVAETLVPVTRNNHVTGRFEWSQRDELDHEIAHATGIDAFEVAGFTAGYTRDVALLPYVQTGIGSNVTFYALADALKPYYGARPVAVNMYLRFRLRGVR